MRRECIIKLDDISDNGRFKILAKCLKNQRYQILGKTISSCLDDIGLSCNIDIRQIDNKIQIIVESN